jgi:hypothetical protein
MLSGKKNPIAIVHLFIKKYRAVHGTKSPGKLRRKYIPKNLVELKILVFLF